MLRKELDHNYIIYPSWAAPAYSWQGLRGLLADPIRSGYLEPGRDLEFFWAHGYPRVPQRFTLTDGPCGGGIILWEGDPRADRGWRWLPIAILQSEADLRLPPGMDGIYRTFDAQVVAIEPHGGGLPKRPALYTCGASTEHVESAGQSVYWVLCVAGARKIKGLESLPEWAGSFGIKVDRSAEVPADVLTDSGAWFADSACDRIWFDVSGGGDGVGYHFAVLVYLAYHLRRTAGRSVVSVHLLADIEGKPNVCRFWNWNRR
jgi:hypothetical protein